jgi:hypothetical protein
MNKTLKTLLVAVGITVAGMANANQDSYTMGQCSMLVKAYAFRDIDNNYTQAVKDMQAFQNAMKWYPNGPDLSDYVAGTQAGTAKMDTMSDNEARQSYHRCITYYNNRFNRR